jgi:hypothetical protein
MVYRAGEELEVSQHAPAPILLGRHLIEMGHTPSPRFGKILSAVYEMQLDGRISTLAEAKNPRGKCWKRTRKAECCCRSKQRFELL